MQSFVAREVEIEKCEAKKTPTLLLHIKCCAVIGLGAEIEGFAIHCTSGVDRQDSGVISLSYEPPTD